MQLDEKEQELVEALEAVGVRRNVATIIVYLKDMDEATSRDIEKGSELRLPEVSIAMRDLRQLGWISEREMKKGEERQAHENLQAHSAD